MTAGALERVLARLRSARQRGSKWTALCPAHEDREPSLSITAKNGKVLLHCHAGCPTEDVVAALGLSMADLFDEERPRSESGQGREIVATYDYTDEAGRLLFEVVRFRPKGFRQRRPDPTAEDGWAWNLKGVRRVVYRLPKVLEAAARGQRVYKVEGEKDVHALEVLGLVATTNAEGAGKWRKGDGEALRGAHVVILPDSDGPGRKDADHVARSLHGLAAGVKVVNLPGLPEKGDVSDWLAAGHTREELEALADAAPEWSPQQSAGGQFPLTDLGNSERLVAAHGTHLRYHVHRGFWLHWTGKVWAEDDTGEVCRLMDRTVRAIAQEAAAATVLREQEDLFKHALKSESVPRLEAAVSRARWRPGIPVKATELDRDPWALNVLNGTLDLRTGKLRPHDPKELHTKLAPVVYDPTADCSRWLQFLREVFQGDDELLGYSQRLGGYMLSGSAQEQCVNFLVGKGSNGKLVFTETWQSMLGDYAKETPFTTFLERRDTATNDLAALVGARMVTASEGAAHQVFNEALLKQLTGGDPVTCRFLHKEFFTYTPTYKILFATNEVPRIQSQTYAVKRRVRIIPFRQTFYAPEDGKEPRRDESLREKLRAELPGILAWAVQGCLTWRNEGLRPPEVVMKETAALFESMDPLADFLEQECVLHSRALVETGVLWRAYLAHCEREQRPPAFKFSWWFTRSLMQRDGVDLIRRHDGRYLTGVGLRAEESPKLAEMSDHARA
jgi:putative DNA primase/helicase